MSVEEYLEQESRSETKQEYYGGRVVAMTGGTVSHSRLVGQIHGHLFNHFENHPCEAFFDLKVYIAKHNAFTYPDLLAVCGDLEYYQDRKDIITNPRLIIEVLSPSTQSFDRGEKFLYYRALPSLEMYLMVEQARPHLELFQKQANGDWSLHEIDGLDQTLELEPFSFSLPMTKIYQRVTFASGD